MKVLLINQNPVIKKLVGLASKKLNLEVESVAKIASNFQIDDYMCIIVDDENANKNFDRLMSLQEDIKICLLFARNTQVKKQEFNIAIQKPFLPTDILEVLNECVPTPEELERRARAKAKAAEKGDSDLGVAGATGVAGASDLLGDSLGIDREALESEAGEIRDLDEFDFDPDSLDLGDLQKAGGFADSDSTGGDVGGDSDLPLDSDSSLDSTSEALESKEDLASDLSEDSDSSLDSPNNLLGADDSSISDPALDSEISDGAKIQDKSGESNQDELLDLANFDLDSIIDSSALKQASENLGEESPADKSLEGEIIEDKNLENKPKNKEIVGKSQPDEDDGLDIDVDRIIGGQYSLDSLDSESLKDSKDLRNSIEDLKLEDSDSKDAENIGGLDIPEIPQTLDIKKIDNLESPKSLESLESKALDSKESKDFDNEESVASSQESSGYTDSEDSKDSKDSLSADLPDFSGINDEETIADIPDFDNLNNIDEEPKHTDFKEADFEGIESKEDLQRDSKAILLDSNLKDSITSATKAPDDVSMQNDDINSLDLETLDFDVSSLDLPGEPRRDIADTDVFDKDVSGEDMFGENEISDLDSDNLDSTAIDSSSLDVANLDLDINALADDVDSKAQDSYIDDSSLDLKLDDSEVLEDSKLEDSDALYLDSLDLDADKLAMADSNTDAKDFEDDKDDKSILPKDELDSLSDLLKEVQATDDASHLDEGLLEESAQDGSPVEELSQEESLLKDSLEENSLLKESPQGDLDSLKLEDLDIKDAKDLDKNQTDFIESKELDDIDYNLDSLDPLNSPVLDSEGKDSSNSSDYPDYLDKTPDFKDEQDLASKDLDLSDLALDSPDTDSLDSKDLLDLDSKTDFLDQDILDTDTLEQNILDQNASDTDPTPIAQQEASQTQDDAFDLDINELESLKDAKYVFPSSADDIQDLTQSQVATALGESSDSFVRLDDILDSQDELKKIQQGLESGDIKLDDPQESQALLESLSDLDGDVGNKDFTDLDDLKDSKNLKDSIAKGESSNNIENMLENMESNLEQSSNIDSMNELGGDLDSIFDIGQDVDVQNDAKQDDNDKMEEPNLEDSIDLDSINLEDSALIDFNGSEDSALSLFGMGAIDDSNQANLVDEESTLQTIKDVKEMDGDSFIDFIKNTPKDKLHEILEGLDISLNIKFGKK